MTKNLILLLSLFLITKFSSGALNCFDENLKKPVYCHPVFYDAAKTRKAVASNTCGYRFRQKFCYDLYTLARISRCEYCDANNPFDEHGAHYITDGVASTFWASETLADNKNIHYHESINVTIDLGGQHEVQHVGMLFRSQRPRAMILYRKESDDIDWQPWAYFSQNCEHNFQIPSKPSHGEINKIDELVCYQYYRTTINRDLFVYFAPIEKRPGEDEYMQNPNVRNWALATQIRMEIRKLATHGDEYDASRESLRIYYAALSSVTVIGRMFCNGHGSEHVSSNGGGFQAERRCKCDPTHFTTGKQCELCMDGFRDVPWQPATLSDAHPCQPCNCNGNSRSCVFDYELYESSEKKSGGRCINCENNSMGVHCELCKPQHYRDPINEQMCLPCRCNELGSLNNGQCNATGQCQCKFGVTGDKCDRCMPGYFAFGKDGCQSCNCTTSGTLINKGDCDPESGRCTCKANVIGDKCNECKPGHFGLSWYNPLGCQACFCFGHSTNCTQSFSSYVIANSTIAFDISDDKIKFSTLNDQRLYQPSWKNATTNSVNVSVPSYITYPSTSNQRPDTAHVRIPVPIPRPTLFRIYNLVLELELSFTQFEFISAPPDRPLITTTDDIRLNTRDVSVSVAFDIFNNPQPKLSVEENNIETQIFRFMLNEQLPWKWERRNNVPPMLLGYTMDFQRLLAELLDIEIRLVFDLDITRVHRVTFQWINEQQQFNNESGENNLAMVEKCMCPPGLIGDSCEQCSGFHRREPRQSSRFSTCLPCQCNGHATTCNEFTGECHCTNGTSGSECSTCARGYYGNALNSTIGCSACECPGDGPCEIQQIVNLQHNVTLESLVCLECPDHRVGYRCERCGNGFFGKPEKGIPCQKCNCNGLEDPNVGDVCHHETGVCQSCTKSTTGDHCETCQKGFFGDPTTATFTECKPCGCYQESTQINPDGIPECDSISGQCQCLNGFVGNLCDRCLPGEYIASDLVTGSFCTPCNCNAAGSKHANCSLYIGQCECKKGVHGANCDKCRNHYYGIGEVNQEDSIFKDYGCMPCMCHPGGTLQDEMGNLLPCDIISGACVCKDNVMGDKCDKPALNYYNLTAESLMECPKCYGQLGHALNRVELTIMDKLTNITSGEDFQHMLMDKINKTVLAIEGIITNITNEMIDVSKLRQITDNLQPNLLKQQSRWTNLSQNRQILLENQMACLNNDALLERIHIDLEQTLELVMNATLNMNIPSNISPTNSNSSLIESFIRLSDTLTSLQSFCLKSSKNLLLGNFLFGDLMNSKIIDTQLKLPVNESREFLMNIIAIHDEMNSTRNLSTYLANRYLTINYDLSNYLKELGDLHNQSEEILSKTQNLFQTVKNYTDDPIWNETNISFEVLVNSLDNLTFLNDSSYLLFQQIHKMMLQVKEKKEKLDYRAKRIENFRNELENATLFHQTMAEDREMYVNIQNQLSPALNETYELIHLLNNLDESQEIWKANLSFYENQLKEKNVTLLNVEYELNNMSQTLLENSNRQLNVSIHLQDTIDLLVNDSLLDKEREFINKQEDWSKLFNDADELISRLDSSINKLPSSQLNSVNVNGLSDSVKSIADEVKLLNITTSQYQETLSKIKMDIEKVNSTLNDYFDEYQILLQIQDYNRNRTQRIDNKLWVVEKPVY